VFDQLLEKLAFAFEEHEIEYMVIGGQALLLYGEPRLTKDIDVTLGVGPEELDLVLEIVSNLKWKTLVDKPESFVSETLVLPCVDEETDIRIDIIFSIASYEREALKRVHKQRVGEAMVCYASVEDLIIHKMVAGRPRDLEDVRVLLIKNVGLDEAYLEKLLTEFGELFAVDLLDRFNEIRHSTG